MIDSSQAEIKQYLKVTGASVARRTIRWAVVAGLLVIGTAWAQDTPETIPTAVVIREMAPLERLYDGTVEAVQQATVSAQTAGRVAEVFYDVDQHVEAGAAIIRFTDVEQQARLRQARAGLTEARARQREAEEQFTRIADLFQVGTVSKREYDQALAARDSADARVDAADSDVKAAEQQVEYTLVRAPYAGIVTGRHVEVGESVTVGQRLMSGLSLEVLRIAVDVPQQVAVEVRRRQSAAVITDEGRVAPTQITVFPFADEETNSFTVRLDLPDGQFGLYPGMFVKVAFVVGEAERVLVPIEALVRRSEVTGVYVVDGEFMRLRQVRTGNEFDEHVEVLSGLVEGERVAIDPVQAGIYVKTKVSRSHDE